MTAMPAFGAQHDEEALWGIVAFAKLLPGMTPEEFQSLNGGSTTGGSMNGGSMNGRGGDEGAGPSESEPGAE